MGDKSIKNTQVKKKKKAVLSDTPSSPSTYTREVMVQPEIIKKKKKIK